MYAIPAETASQNMPFEKENLPGPGKQYVRFLCIFPANKLVIADALQTKTGERDGQQLFIRENDNSVTAHLWSSSRGQWDLVSEDSSPKEYRTIADPNH